MKKFNTIIVSAFIFFQIVHCTLNIDNCEAQSGWFWQNPYPTGNDLNCVSFVNSNTGYFTGVNGTTVKTTDGGNSWNVCYSDQISLFFHITL